MLLMLYNQQICILYDTLDTLDNYNHINIT